MGTKTDESWFKRYQVDVPECTRGAWSIERFTVEKEAAQIHRLQCLFGGHGARGISPGTYTRLRHRSRGIVMSDTPAEIRDHYEVMRMTKLHADRGDCTILIHGLGLGMFPNWALGIEGVTKVTIVEIDQDVIDLTGSYYLEKFGERLEIIHDDALTWKPPTGSRWNIAWHDIWDSICQGNWDEIKSFHRRFGRRSDWQGSWSRPEIQKMNRQDRQDRYWY
jgi:hypothetical protein